MHAVFEKLGKVQRLKKSGRVVLHNSHVLFQRCIVARVITKTVHNRKHFSDQYGTVSFIRDERAELIGKKIGCNLFFS
jgi:hypothetical protein